MLQAFGSQESAAYEDSGVDLGYFIGIAKRRFFYFAVPFLVLALLGLSVTIIQRPIFRAAGLILVESPEIPADLVKPTVTQAADQRIHVIQQRIMSRDNLMAVINKLKLFPLQQQYMSGTELLDMVRDRIDIEPYDPDAAAAEKRQKESGSTTPPPAPKRNTNTIAFTLSFDYEVPDLAAKGASEFLTTLLNEDAQKRTTDAAATTKFLEKEVKRLQAEHDSIGTQLAQIKQRPPDLSKTNADQAKLQMTALTGLQAELIEKSAKYSDGHPEVKSLKKRIADLQRLIANGPQTAAKTDAPSIDVETEVLERQQVEVEKLLDEATRKATNARLGESMERDQEAEKLDVVEQPGVPAVPVKPKKLKWYAVALALAFMGGCATAGAAEFLNMSIRSSRELNAFFGRSLVVAIPYIATATEQRRNRLKIILWSVVCLVLAATIVSAFMFGVPINSWVDPPLADMLSHLAK